ncbi:MAG: hypothetical protein QME68_07955, partial [Elusimicrobiota bacterium]|nr:hypothetical protein [Elusimicrobiota bacterium]
HSGKCHNSPILIAQAEYEEETATVIEEKPAVKEERPKEKTEEKKETKPTTTKRIPSGQIVVTDVKLKDKKAEIVINDLIKIREIEVKKIGERTVVIYPVYISKAGKVYPQVKILTKQANDAILKAIETGKATKPEGLPDEMKFEITKFSPFTRSGSSLRIFAAVTFNDAIEIECKIMEGISKRTGNPYKFVSWPSRREEGSDEWVKQVLIKGKFKQKIDKALLNKYEVWKKEGGGADEFE